MTSSHSAPQPTRCPLCGQENQCAMEVERVTGFAQAPCWCIQAKFSQELLEQLPVEALGRACICAACAQSLSLRT